MTAATREPEEVLAELGRRLDDAYRDAGSRQGWLAGAARRGLSRVPGRRSPRWAIGVVAAVLFAGPAAVATHDTLFTQPPPALPGLLTAPGAVTPDAAGTPVYVASGSEGGVAWRLSASVCRYGAVQAVGLFLDVPGGGAGTRCDVASRLPGGHVSPQALGERRVQTYVDPVANRTWVFGVLPVGAAHVRVSSRSLAAANSPLVTTTVPVVPIDPRAVDRGVPAGLRVFVVALSSARDVPRLDVTDATGAPMLRCGRDRRCLPASTSQESHS